MKKQTTSLCYGLIALIFAAVFAYTFNPRLDLNGDNACYYIYATSLARGDGYSDISVQGDPPTNTFPPGYPLLMAPLRAATESIVAQKVLNGLFLLGAVLLLFSFTLKTLRSKPLALTLSIVVLLNYRVAEFATMMMAEMSCLFFTTLTCWLAMRYDDRQRLAGERPWWREPLFWLIVLSAAFTYHIRTQAVALAVGVAIWFFATGRWRAALGFVAGFAAACLPWIVRGRALGAGGNRYLGQAFGDGGVVERGFATLKMLVTKALPNTVTPYLQVDYAAPATAGEWLAGVLLVALIGYGFWQMRRFFWLFVAYSAATIGIICLWSAPSGNRYITVLVPLLEAGLVVGLYALVSRALSHISLKFNPLWLLVPAFLLARGPLERRHEQARAPFPAAYVNFFEIGRWARTHLPEGSVVCSRKPELLYVSTHAYGCNYAWSEDDLQVIRSLIDQRVDFVVLEQLGYASTMLNLYPAIMKHPTLFEVVHHLPAPDTYLLRFDRLAAEKLFE